MRRAIARKWQRLRSAIAFLFNLSQSRGQSPDTIFIHGAYPRSRGPGPARQAPDPAPLPDGNTLLARLRPILGEALRCWDELLVEGANFKNHEEEHLGPRVLANPLHDYADPDAQQDLVQWRSSHAQVEALQRTIARVDQRLLPVLQALLPNVQGRIVAPAFDALLRDFFDALRADSEATQELRRTSEELQTADVRRTAITNRHILTTSGWRWNTSRLDHRVGLLRSREAVLRETGPLRQRLLRSRRLKLFQQKTCRDWAGLSKTRRAAYRGEEYQDRLGRAVHARQQLINWRDAYTVFASERPAEESQSEIGRRFFEQIRVVADNIGVATWNLHKIQTLALQDGATLLETPTIIRDDMSEPAQTLPGDTVESYDGDSTTARVMSEKKARVNRWSDAVDPELVLDTEATRSPPSTVWAGSDEDGNQAASDVTLRYRQILPSDAVGDRELALRWRAKIRNDKVKRAQLRQNFKTRGSDP